MASQKLDKLDKQILRMIAEDARVPKISKTKLSLN